MSSEIKRLAETLQDNEIAILKSFKGRNKLEKVNKLTKLEFLRAGLWLKNKGLIKINKSKTRYIAIDALGKKYIKQGLPELRLLNILRKRKLHLEDINKYLTPDEKRFAVGYLKQKNWIDINNGLLTITPTGRKIKATIESRFLKKLAKSNIQEEDLIDEDNYSVSALIRRKNIIKLIDKSNVNYNITSLGRKVLELLPSKKMIGVLSQKFIKNEEWRKIKLRRYDVSAPVPRVYPGKKQPYYQFLDNIRKKLVEMGFKEMTGPIIETEFWNFDALYQPQNHPARDWSDTYKLKNPQYGSLPSRRIVNAVKASHETGKGSGSIGWRYKWDSKIARRLMPRAHSTCLSARWLAKGIKSPSKYFSISRVYRPDVLDPTHLIEFNQVEGIIVGKDLNFKNMLGVLKQFAVEFAGVEKVKFYPDYYPFTEPSVQISGKHPVLGWVELAGAGIFRPELTRPLGVKEPVLAWAFGIDRLAMCKLGINDIRYIFSQDLNWLRKERLLL